MSTELPIACTLSAAEMPARLAEIAALAARAVEEEQDADRLVLRFRHEGETRVRLEALVAAEAECCAFLQFVLIEDAEAVSLTITAPPGQGDVLRHWRP